MQKSLANAFFNAFARLLIPTAQLLSDTNITSNQFERPMPL
jgi:hypothetical protein